MIVVYISSRKFYHVIKCSNHWCTHFTNRFCNFNLLNEITNLMNFASTEWHYNSWPLNVSKIISCDLHNDDNYKNLNNLHFYPNSFTVQGWKSPRKNVRQRQAENKCTLDKLHNKLNTWIKYKTLVRTIACRFVTLHVNIVRTPAWLTYYNIYVFCLKARLRWS